MKLGGRDFLRGRGACRRDLGGVVRHCRSGSNRAGRAEQSQSHHREERDKSRPGACGGHNSAAHRLETAGGRGDHNPQEIRNLYARLELMALGFDRFREGSAADGVTKPGRTARRAVLASDVPGMAAAVPGTYGSVLFRGPVGSSRPGGRFNPQAPIRRHQSECRGFPCASRARGGRSQEATPPWSYCPERAPAPP